MPVKQRILFTFCIIFSISNLAISAIDEKTDTNTRVDTSTMTGKIMCGYQGWFNCEGDSANLGWTLWAKKQDKPFAPGNVAVDLWPDVSYLDADERYSTGFTHDDGRVAQGLDRHAAFSLDAGIWNRWCLCPKVRQWTQRSSINPAQKQCLVCSTRRCE